MAKTKALISFAVTAKLICVFVFAYAKNRFSHDAAHLSLSSYTLKFLNFQTQEIFAVINLKFKQRGQAVEFFCQKDANGIAHSEDPEQSDLGLHCFPWPICPKT